MRKPVPNTKECGAGFSKISPYNIQASIKNYYRVWGRSTKKGGMF
jgi:hypothetical protein